MAYLQNNSALIPNGLTRYTPHSNQCDETNCSLAKRFGDAESCAQCLIYYDQRPVRFADRTICGGVYRSVLLIDELSNLPPNSYGTLAKRKREKVYYALWHSVLQAPTPETSIGRNRNCSHAAQHVSGVDAGGICRREWELLRRAAQHAPGASTSGIYCLK